MKQHRDGDTVTPAEAIRLLKRGRRSREQNIPKVVDGARFDSTSEADRWGELKMLLLAGEIRNLRRQVTYRIEWNGVHVCDYRADFVYDVPTMNAVTMAPGWSPVVEDRKGRRSPMYRLKRRLMFAAFGITILETGEERRPKRWPTKVRGR